MTKKRIDLDTCPNCGTIGNPVWDGICPDCQPPLLPVHHPKEGACETCGRPISNHNARHGYYKIPHKPLPKNEECAGCYFKRIAEEGK